MSEYEKERIPNVFFFFVSQLLRTFFFLFNVDHPKLNINEYGVLSS